MAANVITFASSKGGSGKTTICAGFASLIAELGKKVLIVDCDEATHGMTLLYLDAVVAARKGSKEGVAAYGIFDYLLNGHRRHSQNNVDREEPGQLRFVQVKPGVLLLPATFWFERKVQSDPEEFTRVLRILIKSVSEKFDYILIDAQAGTDSASAASLRRDVCHEVIIISEFDPLSTAGIERMKALFPADLAFERTRILLNKLLPEFVEKFTEFLSVARYLPPLPWTADVVRAYSKRKLALDVSTGNEYTVALIQTVRELLSSQDVELLESWVSDKAKILKEPIVEQLEQEKDNLRRLYYARSSKAYMADRYRLFFNYIIGAVVLSAAGILGFYLYTNTLDVKSSWSDLSKSGIAVVAVLAATLPALQSWLQRRLELVTGAESAILSSEIRATEKKIEELEFISKASPSEVFRGRNLKSKNPSA